MFSVQSLMYVIAPSGPLLKTLPQYRPTFKGVAQMVTFYKMEMIRSLFCKGGGEA